MMPYHAIIATMNFLITGSAGFLGAALARRLVREGHQVRGIDDLSTGQPQSVSGILFTRGDVNDRPKLWTLLQDVDCVYHLAARVLVAESVLYPREYNATNVGGTVCLMEAMRDVGVRRVVFISSGAVYGNQDKQPLREDFPLAPRSPYAVSKLAAEYYVRTIGALWGIETVCLRVFNAYGPGQHLPPSHPPVIPNMLHQAVGDGTIVIHGDGNQTRDFVFVDDVVRSMVASATAPKVDRSIINIGSGMETSIKELAKLVIEVTGSKAEIVHTPRTDPGVARMCAKVSLAREKLGFKSKVSLAKGLALTLEQDRKYQKTAADDI
jgi:UDP-glucose 4-epimerase